MIFTDAKEVEKEKKYSRDWGGAGGHDQTVAVKRRKTAQTFAFFRKKKNYKRIYFLGIYLLVMPKYWGKQIFSLGSFPEVV